jgi:hypothetical protein
MPGSKSRDICQMIFSNQTKVACCAHLERRLKSNHKNDIKIKRPFSHTRHVDVTTTPSPEKLLFPTENFGPNGSRGRILNLSNEFDRFCDVSSGWSVKNWAKIESVRTGSDATFKCQSWSCDVTGNYFAANCTQLRKVSQVVRTELRVIVGQG